MSRLEKVDRNFRKFIQNWKGKPVRKLRNLPENVAWELFESQVRSRHLDYEARRLRAQNLGFYTIGSAGHEGNVVLGRLLRFTDPVFLHYRSGAFMMERSRHLKNRDPIEDTLLSFCAATSDPIAGGRHKVWGSSELWVPPQTSTIASHLPKAVGAALSIDRGRRLKLNLPIPDDSIVGCSFGDASTNHSTALGAFNAAQWAAFQHLPVPILFVCEDNDIGISVRTPNKWIEANFSQRPGLHYFQANGLDLEEAYEVTEQAVSICRSQRVPTFLHLKMVRLFGHAGSDVETEYLANEEIEEFESKDPLLQSARILLESGVAKPDRILTLYDEVDRLVREISKSVSQKPKLKTAEEVMAPLAPYHPKEVQKEANRKDYKTDPIEEKPRHLAMQINRGLSDLMNKYPEMILFGEDIAKKGGVYHVTTGLYEKFGVGRVFNTLLDEQTILGLGIGAAHFGFLPVPEIQYLAYYHNAEDQIRGEAGSMQYFSNGQFQNPMVIRIASFAYQKGFGGHFHNDNAIGCLREVPGIVIAAPSRGDDAVEMLRTVMALAKVDGRIVFFLEPIALYMTKDLYEPNDGKWLSPFPPAGTSIPLGVGKVYEPKGKDLTIITYANGLYMSLRVAKKLREQFKIQARVLDLRWLAPLPEEQILSEALATGKVLVVDECRQSGGISDSIVALLTERGNGMKMKVGRINALDTYIPLAAAANLVLPSEDQILAMARKLVGKINQKAA